MECRIINALSKFVLFVVRMSVLAQVADCFGDVDLLLKNVCRLDETIVKSPG